jgi:hypothetical protein
MDIETRRRATSPGHVIVIQFIVVFGNDACRLSAFSSHDTARVCIATALSSSSIVTTAIAI